MVNELMINCKFSILISKLFSDCDNVGLNDYLLAYRQKEQCILVSHILTNYNDATQVIFTVNALQSLLELKLLLNYLAHSKFVSELC